MSQISVLVRNLLLPRATLKDFQCVLLKPPFFFALLAF